MQEIIKKKINVFTNSFWADAVHVFVVKSNLYDFITQMALSLLTVMFYDTNNCNNETIIP